MKNYRCTQCGKLLFEGDFEGTVKKICPKCKNENMFKEESATPETWKRQIQENYTNDFSKTQERHLKSLQSVIYFEIGNRSLSYKEAYAVLEHAKNDLIDNAVIKV